MVGCLRTRVYKQPIIVLLFEFENDTKFCNLGAKEALIILFWLIGVLVLIQTAARLKLSTAKQMTSVIHSYNFQSFSTEWDASWAISRPPI